MIHFGFYEDNGGGLSLIVWSEDGLIAGANDLEYAPEGIGLKVYSRLKLNAVAEVKTWDNLMVLAEAHEVWDNMTVLGFGKLVADDNRIYPGNMGRAAERYFGIEKE